MSRHRAPASHSRAFTALAVTGAALGASMLSPAGHARAVAAMSATPADIDEPAPSSQSRHHVDRGQGPGEQPAKRLRRALRPMTSGEQQYRNGCRQGYIVDDCDKFTAHNLLRRGIDPYL
jgi:hypothetical protein